MVEQIQWCPRCEQVQITIALTAWCSGSPDCQGVTMEPIGYLDGNKPIYKDIEEPRSVK